MTNAKSLVVLCLCVIISACGKFHSNAKLESYDKSTGYRYKVLEKGPNNTDSLYVILTFSGGGTRAAALSYGVMETLSKTIIVWEGEEKTLLDEVDIISSVSGGSFTAGYYGLHRDDLFNGEFEEIFLKKDIQGALFRELFIPTNWFKLMGPSYGRSDLAADYYNKHIFSGNTYQALIDQDTRPFVMFNTTDMTLGAQFPMIQDQFDLICSDLAQLPIARAVASSSAFPGLLTPLTYQNYAPGCNYDEPIWVKLATGDRLINAERAKRAADRRSYYDPESLDRPRRDYVHLIDGGVADNIGIRGPAWALSSTDSPYSLMQMANNKEIKTLLVIVVNAGTNPDSKLDDSASVPGMFKVVETAATTPMDNYSFDSVKLFTSEVAGTERDVKILNDCQTALDKQCPGAKIDTSLYHYKTYLTQVAFQFIEDSEERHFFENIGTNFSLDPETVDELQGIGCTLLQQDEQFKSFIGLHGRDSLVCSP